MQQENIWIMLYIVCFMFFLTNAEIKIWGPGLNSKLAMPARYFFIENSNKSTGLGSYKVEIKGGTGTERPCRIWPNLLDLKDGSIIVRYKLYETCLDLEISVQYEGNHVGKSPYKLNGYTYTEDCYCPNNNIQSWFKEWDCVEVPKQIKNDLSGFAEIDYDLIRDKIIQKYDSPNSISMCHYVILNNKIHRKCYGKHVGFKMFMDNILLSLSRKIILPDIELFVNLGDWPLSKNSKEAFPIFSWCGSMDSYDIVMPTYDITESTLENMGRVMLDMLSVQGNVKDIWEHRIPKAFWRGRDSSRERLKLIKLGKAYPELFNVSLTNFFFFRDEQDEYGPKVDHVSFFSFFDYKYQLNLDGTVAAYRFPYLLAGGSLVFKQESQYYEHFYNEVLPNIHYIPIKRNLSDLVEKINWAKNNENLAEKIARNGQKVAQYNLLPQNIFCYYATLLHEFSKNIVSKITVFDDMELVGSSKSDSCNCLNSNKKDEL